VQKAESARNTAQASFKFMWAQNMKRAIALLIVIAASVGLVGCGNSAKSLLSTGSLFGGKKPAAAPQPQAAKHDPGARALQVGWVSARASKCGFYFDPAKLKQQYLAAEAAGGMPLDQLRKVELTYQYSLKSTLLKIGKDDGYCNEHQTTSIRNDLQRHLAGDFTPRKRKKVKEEGSFFAPGSLGEPDKMDREKIFNPRG